MKHVLGPSGHERSCRPRQAPEGHGRRTRRGFPRRTAPGSGREGRRSRPGLLLCQEPSPPGPGSLGTRICYARTLGRRGPRAALVGAGGRLAPECRAETRLPQALAPVPGCCPHMGQQGPVTERTLQSRPHPRGAVAGPVRPRPQEGPARARLLPQRPQEARDGAGSHVHREGEDGGTAEGHRMPCVDPGWQSEAGAPGGLPHATLTSVPGRTTPGH